VALIAERFSKDTTKNASRDSSTEQYSMKVERLALKRAFASVVASPSRKTDHKRKKLEGADARALRYLRKFSTIHQRHGVPIDARLEPLSMFFKFLFLYFFVFLGKSGGGYREVPRDIATPRPKLYSNKHVPSHCFSTSIFIFDTCTTTLGVSCQ